MAREMTRNSPKKRSGGVREPSRALGGKTRFPDHRFFGGPGRQQSHFDVPAGTPNSTKSRFWVQKGVLGVDFLSIFLASSVFLIFGLDLSSIFDEKLMEILMDLFKVARNFFHLATP